MGTKTGLIIGLAVGFVLGTRAGDAGYEKLKAVAGKIRQTPVVSKPLDAAGEKVADAVRIRGEEITDAVAEAVKERLFGVKEDSTFEAADVVKVERSLGGSRTV